MVETSNVDERSFYFKKIYAKTNIDQTSLFVVDSSGNQTSDLHIFISSLLYSGPVFNPPEDPRWKI